MTSNTTASLTEATLLHALAEDLDGAFEQLVLCFQDRLYRFALRLCGNAQDAEEITQDSFVRAYRALCGYTPERIRALTLRPWLYRIALNVVRNRLRGRRLPMSRLDAPEGAPAIVAGAHQQPELVFERGEWAHMLNRSLAALPERYRTALVLRHIEGLSYPELAALLEQPVGTIKSHVHRGTRLLRAALDSHWPQEEV